MTNVTALRPRNWLHTTTGLVIWLPCDKKTFRIVSRDGAAQTPRRFRSLKAAVAFLNA